MAHCDRHFSSSIDFPEIARLWLLRFLMNLGGHEKLVNRHGLENDTIAQLVGLGTWVEPTSKTFNEKLIRSDLKRLLRTAERMADEVTAPPILHANVGRLADLIGFSATDCRILEFAVLINIESILDDAIDWLGYLSSHRVVHVLSILLALKKEDVRLSLRSAGPLAKSGILSVARGEQWMMAGKLQLLTEGFADLLLSSDADPVTLLSGVVSPAPPGHLTLGDYEHLDSSFSLMQRYLRVAIDSGRKGVNVLIHGKPGTGKSQLPRTLARELGCDLFEITSEDDDGDLMDGPERVRAFRAAQCMFARRRVLIVFDEVEDIFADGDRWSRSTAGSHKASINRTLEENPVPAIWISNSISGFDSAFIRRFDMVMELPIPPKKQRERIIRAASSDLLNSTDISRIARSDDLSPAVVLRASSVIRSISSELNPVAISGAIQSLIENTLHAQGHPSVRQNEVVRLPDFYDPTFIHSDADLAEVATGLMKSKVGRLCLYGAPGTGKTAYARWLAEQMDIPLLIKRGSDLLSPWLGITEKNIAKAFSEAEDDGALLLIDEADSFLQDRRGAQRSWEVTEVNEMLTQMEAYGGLFIASTNLMEKLDEAALRRFDLKVKFGFLVPKQAAELLVQYCLKFGICGPKEKEISRLSRLKNLTLGDFATIARQHRFRAIASSAKFVGELEAECALKDGAHAAIGFLR